MSRAGLAGVWALVLGGHALALWAWQFTTLTRLRPPEVVWLQMPPPEPEATVPPLLRPTQPKPKPQPGSAQAVAAPPPAPLAAPPAAPPAAPAPVPGAEPRVAPAAPASAGAPTSAATSASAAASAVASVVPGGEAWTGPSLSASYLNNPPPQYPPMSKRMGEQGRVVVRVLIDEQGVAQQAELHTSSGYSRLDRAALQAAQSWRYVPGQRGGRVQAMWFNVPIVFDLKPSQD